jgi:glutamyl endopeptidase
MASPGQGPVQAPQLLKRIRWSVAQGHYFEVLEAAMAKEGHQARRSERDFPAIREAATPARPRVSRASLPYFNPPISRFSEAGTAPPRRTILEAAAPIPIAAPMPVATQRTATSHAAGAVQPADVRLPDAALASFGNHAILEVVIGNDDRVKVTAGDLTTNPYRQIAALRIEAQTGALFVGTGWYIGPRALATAGHCVYLHDEGGWPKSIEVIPAKFGPTEPYGQLQATRFRAAKGWTELVSQDFDYGVILLDSEETGKRVGWFEVDVFGDAQLSGDANISGYPADRDNANFQYFHARPLKRITETRLVYEIDTFGGQSGSPIWLDIQGEGVVAVGVHTTGGATGNSGTRISEDVIQNLIAWRDES